MPRTKGSRRSKKTRSGVAPDRPAALDGSVALAELAQELATYREHLPELLREHEGRFVLIKDSDIVGVFPDCSAALREGHRRFGVVPFLVKQIAATEPVVYLPNVVS